MLANSLCVKLLFFYFYRISIFFLIFPFIVFSIFYLFFRGFVVYAFFNCESISVFLNYFGYPIFIEYFFKYIWLVGTWFFYSWVLHCCTGISHIFDEYLDDTLVKTCKNRIIREKHYKINFKKKAGGLFVLCFFIINHSLFLA